MATEGGGRLSRTRVSALGVFLILLASYAFFWHSRDWNTGSRLMLTYALVDRGTVAITGLDQQTGDKAYFRGEFYSDKLPGYPLLAALPYASARWVFGLPPHPLNQEAKKYWAADYWVTLATSGLLTAWTAALLVLLARDMGCKPGIAALVGLAYGLSTPAYAYATLAYGHQASAFALLASFLLIREKVPRFEGLRIALAGFLAAYASVIELQVGPVSAILGLYLLVEVLGRRHHPSALASFAIGAIVPTLVLLAYNQIAFGSPWDMGYFHEVAFSHVHSRSNRLGLMAPDWSKLEPLLWSRYRGLFFYAPILILALPGWAVLLWRRSWSLAVVSFLVCAAILLVNLSYPEWTGGWSTGPRLLVPLIPFAMIPVAGLLAVGGRWKSVLALVAAGLAVMGGVEMLLFQGAGARIPHDILIAEPGVDRTSDPLSTGVWRLWTGRDAHPRWRLGERFCCNVVSLLAGDRIARLGPGWDAVQFLPLAAAQVVAILALARLVRDPPAVAASGSRDRSDLGVDQQQDGGCDDQEPHDPEAQAERVPPDPPPGFVAGGGIDQADRDDQRQDQPVDVHR
jgi:hypothetical protein